MRAWIPSVVAGLALLACSVDEVGYGMRSAGSRSRAEGAPTSDQAPGEAAGSGTAGASSAIGRAGAAATDDAWPVTGAPGSSPIGTGGASAPVPPGQGCNAVDILFVIDQSVSMCSYQHQLVAAFPSFVDTIDASLPPGTDLHVAITTSSFSDGGSHSESNCMAVESPAVIEDWYANPVAEGAIPGNGYQGRLFEWDGKHYFAATTNDPATMTPLKDWFGAAATAVGCFGGSFDFTVAGAGYVFHPVNDATNSGFVRDAGAVLVLFILTDESDHSPEPLATYHDMVVGAKRACGGGDCVIPAGLFGLCVPGANPPVWQFLKSFGRTPVFGDIGFPNPLPFALGGEDAQEQEYERVIAEALTPVVAQTCAEIKAPE